MRKKIWAIACIVILIAAVCVIIVVRHKVAPGKAQQAQAFSTMEEAEAAADFNMQYSDRLCGYPATGFEANSSTIEVRYGDAGYIRKTYAVVHNSDITEETFNEESAQEIDGLQVTFKGRDNMVCLAEWNDNNFAYTISAAEGIDER